MDATMQRGDTGGADSGTAVDRSPHFGRFLKSLREVRGVTMVGFSRSIGIARTRLAGIESSPRRISKRSTSASILHVLEAIAPLSPSERATFVQLSGLDAAEGLGVNLSPQRASKLVAGRVGSGVATHPQFDAKAKVDALTSGAATHGFARDSELLRRIAEAPDAPITPAPIRIARDGLPEVRG